MSFASYLSRPIQSVVISANGSGFNALPSLTGTSRPIVTGATAFELGPWLEVVASLPFNTSRVKFVIDTGTQNVDTLFNIAIGPAGQEVVVFPNFALRPDNATSREVSIPLALPRGARVSVQAQANYAGTTNVGWSMVFVPQGPRTPAGFPKWSTFNVTPADHQHPLLHPGTYNVRGAWNTLSDSLPFDVPLLLTSISSNIATGGGNSAIITFALGAVGQEIPVAHGSLCRTNMVRLGGLVEEVAINAKRGQRLSWSAISSGQAFGPIFHLPY